MEPLAPAEPPVPPDASPSVLDEQPRSRSIAINVAGILALVFDMGPRCSGS